MSSKRILKKDLNYLTFELLTECFTLRHLHPDMDEDKFVKVLQTLVNKRNDMIVRINHPEIPEGETPGQYYRKLRLELVELVSIVEKLTV